MSTDLNRQAISPDDWISQSEAARLRGVSRQAIAKLVKNGRLKGLAIGGRVLVNRTDVEYFVPRSPGRPKAVRCDE